MYTIFKVFQKKYIKSVGDTMMSVCANYYSNKFYSLNYSHNSDTLIRKINLYNYRNT